MDDALLDGEIRLRDEKSPRLIRRSSRGAWQDPRILLLSHASCTVSYLLFFCSRYPLSVAVHTHTPAWSHPPPPRQGTGTERGTADLDRTLGLSNAQRGSPDIQPCHEDSAVALCTHCAQAHSEQASQGFEMETALSAQVNSSFVDEPTSQQHVQQHGWGPAANCGPVRWWVRPPSLMTHYLPA